MSRRRQTTPNLRAVAERVGLAPCSVSSVLNNAPAAKAIPQSTKERILQAAAELNYRPNFWARSLRTKRTRMVAAITPDFGYPAVARVIAAAQERLQRKGYLLILARLDSADAPFTHSQFHQRGIEGVIAVEAALPQELDLPIATVDLTGLAPSDFTEESVQSWLSELGTSAAESVMRHIEAGARGALPVEPKIRPSFIGVMKYRKDLCSQARRSVGAVWDCRGQDSSLRSE